MDGRRPNRTPGDIPGEATASPPASFPFFNTFIHLSLQEQKWERAPGQRPSRTAELGDMAAGTEAALVPQPPRHLPAEEGESSAHRPKPCLCLASKDRWGGGGLWARTVCRPQPGERRGPNL